MQVQRLRACHIIEAKIMKYHVLPSELAKFLRKASAVFTGGGGGGGRVTSTHNKWDVPF